MSEKKSDPCRSVEEDKNTFSPPVNETLLTSDDDIIDQASIDAGSEKESFSQISKDIPPVASEATFEEKVPKTDYNQDESSRSETSFKTNTSVVSNREIYEPSSSTLGCDWIHKEVPSDKLPKPSTSKSGLFLREERTNFSTAISESSGSRTSTKDEPDMIKDKFRKNLGDLQSESESIAGTSNSSGSLADENDPEEKSYVAAARELCELCLKYLNMFLSDSEGDSDAKNKGEKCLVDCHKTQKFHDAVQDLNKLKSKSNLRVVKKSSVSDSKISDLKKFHAKEGNILEIPRFRRSFSAPPEINAGNEPGNDENCLPKNLLGDITKSLPCSLESETKGKTFDMPFSKESGVLVGASDNKIQRDAFKKLKICRRCLSRPQSGNYTQIAQGESLTEKSKLDIKDTSISTDSKNYPKPVVESIDNDLNLSKSHFTEKKLENISSLKNLETISAADTVESDSKSKELDKTKYGLDKSESSCSDDKTKSTFSHGASESSTEIFKIPVLLRPKKLPKVGSPKQSSPLLGTPTIVKNVTPENKIERPKDLTGRPRSAYYAFSPGSPSGFEMRPYHSLPNVHMPPRKTNVHQNYTADQIRSAVRALFVGPPDPQTPHYRESSVTNEIKALLETMKFPESGGKYGTSKKSLKGRASETNLTKFKSCRKLTFDTPKKEQTNMNPTFQGHSSAGTSSTVEMSSLEQCNIIPSSSEEYEKSAILPKKEMSEPSTSGVLPPATTTNPGKVETFDKVPEHAFKEEQSQNYLLPLDSNINVSVSPSKRKAETLECDSSVSMEVSMEDPDFIVISEESLSKRPVKKGKLSAEMKCEKEKDFADVLIKESLRSGKVQLSPEVKLEKNLKDTTSPLKRKADDIDTESAIYSFKESMQTELQKQTSKRTKFQSAWRVSAVNSDDDDDDDDSKNIELE